MLFNYKAIQQTLGIILVLEAAFLFTPLFFSWQVADGEVGTFTWSLLITLTLGLLLWLPNRGKHLLKKRDIYLIVTGGWVLVSMCGALPYLLSGTVPQLTNALFESISGFTTTGATILPAIEVNPQSILLWRSMTQWIGGMGIVVLMIAIMPLLGIGGMQLFMAESPGVTVDKLTPRIRQTAAIMWVVYLALTVMAFLALWVGGLSMFDAINHAMTTLSTGGFSTKQASVAAFSPHIQYIVVFFMVLAGTNFALLYLGLTGKWRKILQNDELRYYLYYLIIPVVFITFYLFLFGQNFEESFRTALFQVVSIVTTTGFITHDYLLWATPLIYLMFILMFVGGMTGSTAGGIKIMRHMVLIRDALVEFRKQLHPKAILPLRFNGNRVQDSIVYRIMAFVMLYILVAVVAVLILLLSGVDVDTTFGAVAATLGNIGPGIGAVGPVGSYANLPEVSLWCLSALMIIGRLELFTVLILFTPYFWKSY